ncbi:MAG: hypothetical protein JNG90_01340 [Planctomycetaceae bacterium]|nr:hypothetical protein [Planctomycetaceae bacterium]
MRNVLYLDGHVDGL